MDFLVALIKLPFSVILFWYEAQKSRYEKSSERMEVFRILIGLHLKSKIHTNKNIISYTIFGYKVYAYSYKILLYLFRDIFLSKVYFFKTPDQSPVIIDCGANIGMAVLYFKRFYPDSKIIAFEPNPDSFELLKRHVTENNLKNVEIYNKALSNEKKSISFFLGSEKGSVISSIRNDRGGVKEIKVEATLLSDYFKTEKPTIIKMDVEGAEIQILQDLIDTNTLNIPDQYIIEYHHKINDEKGVFSKFLLPFEAKGYDYNIRGSYGQLNSVQDILIHFFK